MDIKKHNALTLEEFDSDFTDEWLMNAVRSDYSTILSVLASGLLKTREQLRKLQDQSMKKKLASDVVNETLRVLFRGDNCPFVGRGTSLEDSWKHMEEEYRFKYIEELTEAVYKKLVKE
jgi:hypothetical protein